MRRSAITFDVLGGLRLEAGAASVAVDAAFYDKIWSGDCEAHHAKEGGEEAECSEHAKVTRHDRKKTKFLTGTK